MPQEYKKFLGAGQKNPIRLWQLSSVKYLTAPVGVLQQLPMMKPVFYYRFVREGKDGVGVQKLMQPMAKQDQVLLQFNDTLPRFALFHYWKSVPDDQQLAQLFSRSFNPLNTVLVDAKENLSSSSVTSPEKFESVEAMLKVNKAIVQTNSKQAGVLLFTQRYQSDWTVTVDGKPAKLLRCNYLCLGVEVPAGKHTVQFVTKASIF